MMNQKSADGIVGVENEPYERKKKKSKEASPHRRPEHEEQGGVPLNERITMNLMRGVKSLDIDGEPALNKDLMGRVFSRENMRSAWKRVKANKGAAGIDGMTIAEFPEFAKDHWESIRQALLQGRYRPSPVLRVEIPKPDGGKRLLGIPTITDRVIQQAISQILNPILDGEFSDSSYGFRPKRSAHDAVKKVRDDIKAGKGYAVDIDLSKYFDTVNHDILMSLLRKRIQDKDLLRLINRYLKAGVQIEGKTEPSQQGVPQGGPLSPLLSNVFLDVLDKELEKRGHRFARYADDFVVLVKSPRAGERVMKSIKRFLEKKLRLKVNKKKSKVVKTSECSFLGFVFKRNKIRWSSEAFAAFKRRIRQLTGRSWGVSMSYRLRQLVTYIRGWIGYYGLSEYYSPIPELDHWIRRRIRMCYWKQWRYCRTKVRALMRMGCSKRRAIPVSMSRKSYWHLSKNYAVQLGMTNQWLKSKGLISIKDLWVKFHYPEQSR